MFTKCPITAVSFQSNPVLLPSCWLCNFFTFNGPIRKTNNWIIIAEKYEIGGSTQSQVIFHPESYFPRSAKFNFTVDVLGASVNLLETAARFEGFETLIEQMFGPEGYFPDDRLMQLLKIKPTEALDRGKRSPNEVEMNEIKSNLEKLQDKVRIISIVHIINK